MVLLLLSRLSLFHFLFFVVRECVQQLNSGSDPALVIVLMPVTTEEAFRHFLNYLTRMNGVVYGSFIIIVFYFLFDLFYFLPDPNQPTNRAVAELAKKESALVLLLDKKQPSHSPSRLPRSQYSHTTYTTHSPWPFHPAFFFGINLSFSVKRIFISWGGILEVRKRILFES